jgi:hypothetical protein
MIFSDPGDYRVTAQFPAEFSGPLASAYIETQTISLDLHTPEVSGQMVTINGVATLAPIADMRSTVLNRRCLERILSMACRFSTPGDRMVSS